MLKDCSGRGCGEARSVKFTRGEDLIWLFLSVDLSFCADDFFWSFFPVMV